MTAATVPDGPDLPRLRSDLLFHEAPGDATGARAWLIEDPVRQRFFRLSRPAFDLLSAWCAGPAAATLRQYTERTGHVLAPEDIEGMIRFLKANELACPAAGDWKILAEAARRGRRGILSSAAHAYIFFRVPLLRPQTFLDRAWPVVAPLFTRTFALFTALVALAGLWLASRQWDVFVHTFVDFLSLEGVIIYGASLAVIKSLHELGHAFMARRYNVPVPTIGVAFIVLFPILYTDTTSAWRLPARKRVMIDAAGIFTELVIAAWCTLLWALLPDGPLRGVVFAAATLSWVTSLAVNLNPLMRFDGYYLLADIMDFRNLQQRGFALARWRMRELLFGWGEPPPETLRPSVRRFIIIHAWATWIYRFFLFAGIALLVYHMTVKVIGIALFLVEIGIFIAMPVYREIATWWGERKRFALNRTMFRTVLVAGGLLLVLFLPWQGSVRAPALLRAAPTYAVHAPAKARLVEVLATDGASVSQGQLLYRLEAPDLAYRKRVAEARRALASARLARMTADMRDRSERGVIENELASAQSEIASLESLESALVIRAPIAGRIANALPDLHTGLWISPSTRLAVIAAPSAASLVAAISEEDVHRLQPGATGRFVAGEPEFEALTVTLTGLSPTPLRALPGALLGSEHGGPIPTERDGSGEIAGSWYGAAFAALDRQPVAHEMRGSVTLDATRESLAAGFVRRIAAVLVRESGF
ncbi:HlyD family efflux transporter periplasmic adaptor subunit [Zhengella sp. ZM62]|uniref:HlyD family efflux transporter periplasmic adaptor subunit n=1 Tax=Zhengella sedimenti TaxID=3390035 RepID=UPI003974FD7C